MGKHRLRSRQVDWLPGDQVKADGEVVLADDGDPAGVESESVEGAANRALDRVLKRDQRPLGLTSLDGEDRVVDGGRAQRLVVARGGLAEGILGEGASRAEV